MTKGMRLRRILLCACIACLVATLISAGAPAGGAECTWSVVPTTDPAPVASLSAIASASNGTWAVGSYSSGDELAPDKALIEHLEGTTWTTVVPPGKGPRTLSGVAVIASNDVWAVGTRLRKPTRRHSVDKTLALHYDGTAWTTVATPNVGDFGSSLSAVDATAPRDVWAVGGHPTEKGKSKTLTLHYDGTAWSVVPSPNPRRTSGSLQDVAAVSFRTSAWAVGWRTAGAGEQRPLVQQWDGSQWTRVTTPEPAGPSSLAGVDFSLDRTLVAVGNETVQATTHGFSLRMDDDGWTLVPTAPSGGTNETLAGVDARFDTIAVGSYVTGTQLHPLVESYSSAGSSWTVSPAQDQGSPGAYFTDVVSAQSAYAVGAYANPDAGTFRQGSHTLIEVRKC